MSVLTNKGDYNRKNAEGKVEDRPISNMYVNDKIGEIGLEWFLLMGNRLFFTTSHLSRTLSGRLQIDYNRIFFSGG